MGILYKSLGWKLPLVYAFPMVGTCCLMAPLAVVQGIYAKHYGLPLTTIAAVVLLARLFDAISDPIVGYYVDRYYQKTGSRRPFIVVGGILTVICGYYLYVPPDNVSTVYFATWFILFYAAWTLFEIPHVSWASDLGTNSDDKTKIFSFRCSAGYVGLLLFYCIPQLPIFETTDISPETLKVSVYVAGGILLLALLPLYLAVPSNGAGMSVESKSSHVKEKSSTKSNHGWRMFGYLLFNKPFLLFSAASLFVAIGSGMWYGLIFIYVDAYLGKGEQFAQMFMLAFIVGIAITPIWYQLTRRYGKRNMWLLSQSLMMVSLLGTALLSPTNTRFYLLVSLNVIHTFSFAGASVVGPAILSEIVDYSRWKYRVDRTATYYSVYAFLGKANGAIATALALGIAGWYGFDVASGTHSPDSIFGLTLATAWLPSVFLTIAICLIALFPLNSRRCSLIRRRLDQRTERIERMALEERKQNGLIVNAPLIPRKSAFRGAS